MSVSEKMHIGRPPKATQKVQNSPQHVLQPPEASNAQTRSRFILVQVQFSGVNRDHEE